VIKIHFYEYDILDPLKFKVKLFLDFFLQNWQFQNLIIIININIIMNIFYVNSFFEIVFSVINIF